jgi:hypothetical protein
LSGSAKYRSDGRAAQPALYLDRLLQLTLINYALVAAF